MTRTARSSSETSVPHKGNILALKSSRSRLLRGSEHNPRAIAVAVSFEVNAASRLLQPDPGRCCWILITSIEDQGLDGQIRSLQTARFDIEPASLASGQTSFQACDTTVRRRKKQEENQT